MFVLAWDEEHLAGRLTTDRVRGLLTEAIEKLLGAKDRRVCVLIDDLDRCEPAAALRLLEGIKIHLSLPHCVFVLGVNIRQIERAIAPLLPGVAGTGGDTERHAEAAEYLEKLCSHTWKLPFPSTQARGRLLDLWLSDPPGVSQQTSLIRAELKTALVATATQYDCLPANPRKIKGLANTIRQLFQHASNEPLAGSDHPPIGNANQAEADRLLIAASIDRFHPELLRYLQTYPDAWSELINWVNGKGKLPPWSDLGRALEDLGHGAAPRLADESKSTPAEPLDLRFPDPVHLSVFRIHKLLRDATNPQGRNSVTKQSLKRYLDLAPTQPVQVPPPKLAENATTKT